MPHQMNQTGDSIETDLLIIGSGLAGLLCALETAKRAPECCILLITKNRLSDCNSYLAQGGIAAVDPLSTVDNFDAHIQDTLRAGAGLSDSAIVRQILEAGPDAMQILRSHGVQFDTDSLGQEGGHSQRRIYHTGDHTGKSVIATLIEQIATLPNITVREQHSAVNLLATFQTSLPHATSVSGAYVLDCTTARIHTVMAKNVVLATGGTGKVYRYTSNPDTATGDGIAMAYRVGVPLANMEFYQFHPSIFYHPTLSNFLLTEALRGEGAKLINPQNGRRFMETIDPERMELATRDIVARAIFSEMEKYDLDYVHLDITHQSETFLKKHFPMIYEKLLTYGINIARDPIPIVPGAHYLCGGIVAELSGKTAVDHLFAIGECAYTGLHGANRLASNSLLEAAVMAIECAKTVLNTPDTSCPNMRFIPWNSSSVVDARRASDIHVHWRGLRGEMSAYAGMIRTEAGLRDLLSLIQTRREMIENYYWDYLVTRDLIELRNIALVAELVVRAAISREESRGGHYRADYPETDAEGQMSLVQDRNHVSTQRT